MVHLPLPPPKRFLSGDVECGGKRSATPLWYWGTAPDEPKRRRRFALPAHSIWWTVIRCAIRG
jgi:hypothetical protein